jgi:hypothetical protein
VEEGALNRRRAGVLVAAAAVGAEVAAPAGSLPLAALDAAVAAAFAAGAAAVAAVAPRVTDLALAVAVAWVLGTLAGIDGVSSYVVGAAVLVHRAPLALLVLEYPRGAPASRAGRGWSFWARVLAAAALIAPFAPGGASPTLTAGVTAAVTLIVALAAVRGSRAMRAPRLAAAASGSAIAVSAGLAAAEAGPATQLLVAYELVLLATAAGLLGTLAGGRWSAAAASRLVVELGATPAGAPVTARLAEALGDPGLELRIRAGGVWTDEAGRPVPEPLTTNGRRTVTRRILEGGSEVALLHDPAAILDVSAAETAVAVAATAVENARRDREVSARIEELRRLRRGLLDAADEERRQLEVELRSGALREAGELERGLRDIPGRQLAVLRGELVLAREELAEIARGLHPGALLERGLTGALADAAARSPVPVAVAAQVTVAALPAPVERTAYYVAIEALANVAKHSHARRARLELSTGDSELVLRVADDGVGGADPDGGGLGGLRDRIHAIDGELSVHSPTGAGTTIEARLPIKQA